MMAKRRVDYDEIAVTYDRRFEQDKRSDTAVALVALARELKTERILEVGCGTGRWLADLRSVTGHICGLDLSAGMLAQARRRDGRLYLIRGRAARLPFTKMSFDLVYCVNAIHHFDEQRAFVFEVARLLRPGGVLAVVGMDPHGRRESWYVYHYFRGTFETDLARFPRWETVLEWMAEAGFEGGERRVVERILDHKIGWAVLEDPFLHKSATSQLALLTDEAYNGGLRRIRAALKKAEAAGEQMVFLSDISFEMIVGRIPHTG